jgi:dopamine beta-monooxygenase
MMYQALFAVLLTWTVLVTGYPRYQDQIPNGKTVPNPCKPGEFWAGVGHEAVGGAGPRNPFGLDFAANNHIWNPTLCQKDSDGDGKSNGIELGDANCTWTNGTVPPGPAVSHPGVCDPIDSGTCATKNTFLNCTTSSITGVQTTATTNVITAATATATTKSSATSWRSYSFLYHFGALSFFIVKRMM